MTAPVTNRFSPRRAAGFTLIELLLVIIIISVIIALVLPAIGRARDTARAAGTRSLMNGLLSACAAFQVDERRLPGYFMARTMGHQENINRGMSGMENVLLDLSGGPCVPSDPDAVKVGPTATGTAGGEAEITVNIDLIGVPGSGNKMYFAPKSKNYVAQTSDGASLQHQVSSDLSTIRHTSQEGQPQLPDLCDDFGEPLLFWTKDEASLGQVTKMDEFVRESSGMGVGGARFYWAQNAAFLRSNALGKKSMSQVDTSARKYSLIGEAAKGGDGDYVTSLGGLLGHPAYPVDITQPFKNIVPSDERGSFIIQSAGADGFYMGSKDKGGKGTPDHILYYGLNFKNVDGTRYTDDTGKDSIEDVMTQFDDIVVTGGK